MAYVIPPNSWRFDARGWSFGNSARTVGAGQNSIASIRATLGAYANAALGIAAQTEVIVGFCYQNTLAHTGRFLQFHVASGQVAPRMYINTDGSIAALGAGGTPEYGRSASGLGGQAGVQTFYEIRVKFSTTVGEIEVRLNGNPTPVLNLTGLNLGTANATQIEMGLEPAGTREFSAFYLINTSGPAPYNTFLGHARYAALVPGGNGNASEFDGSDGNSTDNYLLVDDDSSADDDTTYVQSSTLNERDTYAMGNMPTAPLTVFAVVPVLRAKKTDAGTRAVAAVIRSDGVDYPGSDHYLGLSYDDHRAAVLVDPDTSAAWTEAGINAMEVGPKVSV